MDMRMVLIVFLLSAPAAAAEQAWSGRELGVKALETVIAGIKSDDSDIRALSAGALGDTGNKSATAMIKQLLTDPDRHVRIAAAEALWKLGNPAGIKTVYDIINDVPAREPVAHSPLVELKTISQNKIREHAIEALTRMKGAKSRELLFGLKNDLYGAIRDVAARELSRLGHEEEMTQFLDALSSSDEELRYQSAAVFSKICNAAALPKLKEMLTKETSLRVRTAVLDAVGCIPARKSAADGLIALTNDKNPEIRHRAVAALAGIKDKKVSARLAEINAGADDLKLKLALLPALLPPGAGAAGKPELETVSRALGALGPDIKAAGVKALYFFNSEDARPLLAGALSDENAAVRLEAAAQILRRFSRKTGDGVE